MPTGYTHKVQAGEITTLRDFALHCSRAFGALITMRDDPEDAPIPRELAPNTDYHDQALARARLTLKEVPFLSVEECDRRAGAEFAEAMRHHTEYETEKFRQRTRYQDMLQKVRDWKVPEDLAALKSFMIEQLEDSIKFDCPERGSYSDMPPVRLTGETWRAKQLQDASRNAAYHEVERSKEIERVEGRNKWLEALWSALPAPMPASPSDAA